MVSKATEEPPPSRSQVVRAVRILGLINLVLGLYMILGAVVAAGGMNLPGSAATMIGGIIGMAAVIIGWGSAVVSGVGLILLARWGRWLAAIWGKVIVWALPIAFGLSIDSLSDFFSFSFAVIIVICLYANIVAHNLARAEFDAVFEPVSREEESDGSRPDDEETTVDPAVQEQAIGSKKISFACEECGKNYTVHASLAGRKAKCKGCGHKFRIPSGSGN
jgi:ribosomal protein S27E